MGNRYLSLTDRFWAKVQRGADTACWLWRGGKANGYGRIHHQYRQINAHRVSWQIAHGTELSAELTIDHLCRNKLCVNPSHLEAVSRGENARRYTAALTACVHGHPFDEKNTKYTTRRGALRRLCRACARDRWRARQAGASI